MDKLCCDWVFCDWLYGLIRNLIGQAASSVPCVSECVTVKKLETRLRSPAVSIDGVVVDLFTFMCTSW